MLFCAASITFCYSMCRCQKGHLAFVSKFTAARLLERLHCFLWGGAGEGGRVGVFAVWGKLGDLGYMRISVYSCFYNEQCICSPISTYAANVKIYLSSLGAGFLVRTRRVDR